MLLFQNLGPEISRQLKASALAKLRKLLWLVNTEPFYPDSTEIVTMDTLAAKIALLKRFCVKPPLVTAPEFPVRLKIG